MNDQPCAKVPADFAGQRNALIGKGSQVRAQENGVYFHGDVFLSSDPPKSEVSAAEENFGDSALTFV
jgi:hypothetical protein